MEITDEDLIVLTMLFNIVDVGALLSDEGKEWALGFKERLNNRT